MKIIIADENGIELNRAPLDEFLADCRDCIDEIDVAVLRAGGEVMVGGGAGPLFAVRAEMLR